MLSRLTLQNLLSFGPEATSIELRPLNVLIGPNGSGKSNFVEALSLLSSVPGELPKPIREGGGVAEWLWKGPGALPRASVDALFGEHALGPKVPQRLRYHLEFHAVADRFEVDDERIENERAESGTTKPFFYFGYETGRPTLNVSAVGSSGPTKRTLQREDIDPTLSILAQRRDVDTYPELTRMGELLGQILLYRKWQFGPDSAVRESCRVDVRTDRLEPGLTNLAARLAALKRDASTKQALLKGLQELSDAFTDLEVIPEGGRLSLYIHEGQDRSIPASRLSDGSLRYLALLAILVDPQPPPLIVIEEPELGLHPDVMLPLAELLVSASARTQVVVTTHSDTLLSALRESPESIVVCERHDGRSALRRLQESEVSPFIEKYRLGELWLTGQLGGTRW